MKRAVGRLRQLRLARGLSLDALAAEMGGFVTKQALSKYETGKANPTNAVLAKLAHALRVKAVLLFDEPELSVDVIAYRAKASFPVRERERLASLASFELEQRLRLIERIGSTPWTGPECQSFSVEVPEDAERAAEQLREEWNLGNAPIQCLTDVLEENGVQVIEVNAPPEFDGMCLVGRSDSQPQIGAVVVKQDTAGERQRFDLAHELGHLMICPGGHDARTQEKIAHRFGSAFLAPKEAILSDVGRRRLALTEEELKSLKKRYGMSKQALVRRLVDLQVITQNHYRYWCIWFSKKDLRKDERDNLPRESPQWFRITVLRAAAEGLLSESEATALGVSVDVDRALTERRRLLALSPEDRDRILARHITTELEHHYAENTEAREWEAAADE